MRIFAELDADGDGSLTQAELEEGGKLRFAKADKNKDGFLSHAELRNQMVEKMQQRSSRKMAKMMALRDTDKDGKLSLKSCGLTQVAALTKCLPAWMKMMTGPCRQKNSQKFSAMGGSLIGVRNGTDRALLHRQPGDVTLAVARC